MILPTQEQHQNMLKVASVKEPIVAMSPDVIVDSMFCDSVTSSSEVSENTTSSSTLDVESAVPVSLEHEENERRVSFGTLQIREYPIIPGVHPSVCLGCPVTLAWEYDGEVTCAVEDYEESRPVSRSMVELRMPARLREDLLRRVGFSRQDIQNGTKQATIVRNRRKRTEETMQLSSIHELLERAKRGTMNMTVNRGSKKKEQQLMRSFPMDSMAGVKPGMKRSASLKRVSVDTSPMNSSMFMLNTV